MKYWKTALLVLFISWNGFDLRAQTITWDETIQLLNNGSETYCFGYPDNETIMLGTDYGMYYSIADGYGWFRSADFSQSHIWNLVNDNNGNLFLTTMDEIFVYRASDKEWHKSANGYTKGIAANSHGHFYLIASKLYKTTDIGKSWSTVNEDITTGRLYIDKHDVIYITSSNGLQRSTDNGVSFSTIGFQGVLLSSCVTNKSGYIFVQTTQSNELYRSKDNGENWTKLSIGSNRLVYSILIIPSEMLIVGTDAGVYYSTDDGDTWRNSGGEVEKYRVSYLSTSIKGTLFAGVSQKGIFRSSNQITSAKNNEVSPVGFKLLQNYPNPFNSSTIIEYLIPEPGIARILIYNANGELIRTITQDHASTGSHSVLWNGNNDHGKWVSSNVYLYQISINNYQEAKKMILLK